MPKPPNRTEPTPDESELQEIFAGIDSTQVRMARDLLASAGIECFVFDRQTSRMLGATPAVPIRLMVHADAAEDARKRLQELGFIS